MKKYAVRFWREESGQDLVEYALLLSILVVAGIAALDTLATTVSNVWNNTNSQLSGS